MRLIIALTTFFFVIQLNSCVSQVDSTKQGTKKKTPLKEKILKDVPGSRSSTAPIISNESKSTSDKGEAVNDAEMGLSIISYQNIIPKAKNNKVKGSKSKDKKTEAIEDELEEEDEEEEEVSPPVQGQKVKLRIQNKHNSAMWYLMPAAGEKEMPKDGKFHSNPAIEVPFLAKKFGKGSEQLVELIYYGKDGQSFRAFYVESGASLLFRNYDLGRYKQGDYVPFWSAKSLDVNNEADLESWLPFSVLSSPNIVLHNKTESGSAKWTNIGKTVDFPSQPIEFIQAEGIKRYQIPVGVVR